MDKVYIVSSGSYSDWHIKAIFASEEKAKFYHDNNNDYDLNEVEEFELSDEAVIEPIHFVECKYYIIPSKSSFSKNKLGEFEFEIKTTNTLDDKIERIDSTYLDDWNGCIRLKRFINKMEMDEEKLKLKYFKVCTDFEAIIKYELASGSDYRSINEILQNRKSN
jgi:hypothetical protein